MAILAITGTGRSGTSLLAEFCRRAGYDPGGRWKNRVDSGRECLESRKASRAARRGRRNEARQRVRRIRRRVVKDPRIKDPRVLRVWAEVRPDARMVVCVRDPSDVARSRLAHPGFFRKVRNKTHKKVARQAETEICQLVLELTRLRVPWHAVRFPDFVQAYDVLHEALCEFAGLDIDRSEGTQIWSNLADFSKVHF